MCILEFEQCSKFIWEGPLICALFVIRTTFKFRWVGGLEIRGRSNWRMKKKAHALKINILVLKYSKTLLEIKKEFYLLLLGNINSFLRQVHKYIFQKYHCTETFRKVCPFISGCCSNWRVDGWVRLNPNIVRILKSTRINGPSLILRSSSTAPHFPT